MNMTFVVPDDELVFLAAGFSAPQGGTLESASGTLGDASVSAMLLSDHLCMFSSFILLCYG